MISDQHAAIATGAQLELSRRRLIDFAEQSIDGFDAAPHLRMLADVLERVERGEIRRLIVTLHPGSGKSTLLQAFAGWYLGRNPKRKIIATSAAAELAERNSRATRALFASEAWPFDAKLSAETTAQHRWSTVEGGGLMAIGVDGNVTGWRGNLILCDDLQNSAGTPTERDGLWAWFREILSPRIEPGGAVIVMQTRWGLDDLVGRIQDSPDGPSWHVVRLPAIAEEDDPLGRKVGEALWPSRFPLEELRRMKITMGSRGFDSQYNSNPVPVEGNLIKAEWLRRYDRLPESFQKVVVAVDAAAKTGISNDWTALVTLGATESDYYVIDIVRRKVEYPDLLRLVFSVCEQQKPSAVYVEDASSAIPMIQELKRDSQLPIVAVKATGSKIARAEGVTGTLEAGRVYLPMEAPWLLDFERELLAFPAAKHDDMVDAFVMALSQLRSEPEFYFGMGRPVDFEDECAWIRRAHGDQ